MIKSVLLSATIFASLFASVEAQPDRQRQPGRLATQDRSDDCRPDLIVADEFIVTRQSIDADTENVTFGFAGIVENLGQCRSDNSRTKLILTLSGGRWLGQTRTDIPSIPSGGYETVQFELTIPYEDLLDEDCTLTRDNWVVTLTADWLETNAETDETNNENVFNFSTSSDSLCASSSDYRLDTIAPFRNPFERPRRLNDRYRH